MVLLRPLDVLLVAKLAVSQEGSTYQELADSLAISKSSVHDAMVRAQAAGLLNGDRSVNRRPTAEFFAFGVGRMIPGQIGADMRGIPSSFGVEPLKHHFGARADAPVWPYAEGTARGPSMQPIFETAPRAALEDARLHSLLALIDATRVGRAREVSLAREELKAYFEVAEW